MRSAKTLRETIDLPLVMILLVAALLRLTLLSVIPNGFQQDEAAAGYDAYSLLKTLHTQYGQSLPLFSKAYEGKVDDYDESNYRFLIIPFVQWLGLTELATRLPAAILGVINIFTFYLFAKEFSQQRKVALLATCFLAISPWHIQISRIAFRAVLFNCIFCLALFLFFRGLKNKQYLPWCGLCFGLCLYTYTSARVFVPLFLLGLVWVYRKELWRDRVQTAWAAAVFLLILGWLFTYWISPELMKRANFSVCIDCMRHNPGLYIAYYISYFYPGFLFRGHPSVRTTAGHIEFLYAFDAIPILVSLFYLFRERSQTNAVLRTWLFLYPIPAALVVGAYDLRATIGIPLFMLLSAQGTVRLADYFRRIGAQRYFRIGAAGLLLASMIVFVNVYYIGFYFSPPESFQYGLKDAIAFAEQDNHRCVVVSDRMHRFHSLFIFYSRYPPELYQRSPIQPYMTTNYTIGKYHVLPIASQTSFDPQCLYMVKPKDFRFLAKQQQHWRVLHTVKTPEGWERIDLIELTAKS